MHQKLNLKELSKSEWPTLSIYRWLEVVSFASSVLHITLASALQWNLLYYLGLMNLWVCFLAIYEVIFRIGPKKLDSVHFKSDQADEAKTGRRGKSIRSFLGDSFRVTLQIIPILSSGLLILALVHLNLGKAWQEQVNLLRLALLMVIGLAFAQHFLNQFVAALERETGQQSLAHMKYLGYWTLVSSLGTALIAALWLYAQIDFSQVVCVFLGSTIAAISIERIIRLVGRWYQPDTLKETTSLDGKVYTLEFLFKYGAPWKNLRKQIEESYGIELEEIPALKMLQGKLEWAILGAILVTWLSTSFTVIPYDSKGVRVHFGRYQAEPMEPGLAVSNPWPFGSIKKIKTEETRFISLGFEQDLGTAVLWNEKHFEGEYNLLVEGGNALLSINVPIYYNISDPVAYLTHSQSPEKTLIHLAYSKLLESTSYRDSFDIMLTSRENITNEIAEGLQEQSNLLGLGLEILFVGLKDIHPPVSVAPAFQAVVSAEEEKLALIEKAKSYKAQVLPQTGQQTNRMRVKASQLAESQKLHAEGEAKRFILNQQQHEKSSYLMESKLLYDTQQSVLSKSAKMLMLKEPGETSEYLMDLRTHQWK
ncbi:MAG: protease modulator HflK [Verrucomicrobiota bacterium]